MEKYGVKVIGVNLDAIERGEDREIFKIKVQENEQIDKASLCVA